MSAYLTVGSLLTPYGGVVLPNNRQTILDGKQVCCVGDKAMCNKHGLVKVVGRSDPSTLDEGSPFALDGAMCTCGCKAVAMQSRRIMEGVGGFAKQASSNSLQQVYSIQYQLLDDETGEPLKNYPYTKIIDGKEVKGVTDSNGFTKKISRQNVFKTELRATKKGGA